MENCHHEAITGQEQYPANGTIKFVEVQPKPTPVRCFTATFILLSRLGFTSFVSPSEAQSNTCLKRMVRKELRVSNRAGIHTRPAARIVRTLANYESEVWIRKGSYEINGKSIIGVMTLAASQGTELTVICQGEDEEAAANALEDLFETGFNEI